MFELATGLRAYSENRKPENLVDYMKHNKKEHDNSLLHLIDTKSGSLSNDLYFTTFVDFGFAATSVEPNERPSVKEMLDFFNKLPSVN